MPGVSGEGLLQYHQNVEANTLKTYEDDLKEFFNSAYKRFLERHACEENMKKKITELLSGILYSIYYFYQSSIHSCGLFYRGENYQRSSQGCYN